MNTVILCQLEMDYVRLIYATLFRTVSLLGHSTNGLDFVGVPIVHANFEPHIAVLAIERNKCIHFSLHQGDDLMGLSSIVQLGNHQFFQPTDIT